MSSKFYVQADGQIIGPLISNQIEKLIAQGLIRKNTLVCPDLNGKPSQLWAPFKKLNDANAGNHASSKVADSAVDSSDALIKISFDCPSCGKKHRVDQGLIGRNAKCTCGCVSVISESEKNLLVPSVKQQASRYPIVEQFELKKSFLDGYQIRYRCPHCTISLISAEKDLGNLEQCSECHGVFLLAQSAIEEINSLRASKVVERQQKQEKKQIAKQQREDKRREAIDLKKQAQKRKQIAVEQRKKEQLASAKELQAASTKGDSPNTTSGGVDQGLLHFRRNTGLKGVMVGINILVDGKVKSKLKNNQEFQIEVTPGEHLIEAKGGGAFGGAKETIAVESGSCLQFSVTYSAFGSLKINRLSGVRDSNSGPDVNLGQVIKNTKNIIDGFNAISDMFDDD